MKVGLTKKVDLPKAIKEYTDKTGGEPYFMTEAGKTTCVFVAHEETDEVAIFAWDNPQEVHSPVILSWETIGMAGGLYRHRHTPMNEL